ncbi:hypothetical protein [Gordonia sp. (in: high G+C Gram-positive bacteria)]|uniref:hypothetical protein n=1 Tax=Gordonia sp. (in: high G+C Gram-positive bacteria) TaxID=84139 RepID=UPI003C730703
MKKLGKWLTWSGLAIAIATVVAGTVLAVMGFGKMSDFQSDAFGVDGPSEFVAEADAILVLYSSQVGFDAPKCTATGPARVESGLQRTNSSVTYNNRSVSSFQSFRFTKAGTYTIVCDAPDVIAGPRDLAAGIFTGVGGILLAVFGGGFGVLLLVIGAILWIIGANTAKAPPSTVWVSGPQPYGTQPYGTQQTGMSSYPNDDDLNRPGN